MRRVILVLLCFEIFVACNLSYQGRTDQDHFSFTPLTSTQIITPQPGILVEGYVYQQDGTGLAGVRIYWRLASYPGVLVATSDETGFYRCEFQPIPGDEMIRVWAELEGYSIAPKESTWTWEKGTYSWRHYYGYEEKVLDFIVEK